MGSDTASERRTDGAKISSRRESMRENKAKHTEHSYREELRLREKRAVRREFCGGAYGCPGEYFRGAPADNCRSGFPVRCEVCWSRPYADEEWIPYESRDE